MKRPENLRTTLAGLVIIGLTVAFVMGTITLTEYLSSTGTVIGLAFVAAADSGKKEPKP